MVCLFTLVNAKQPNILGQMIAEAHEIRENQSNRHIALNAVKQNHNDESVSKSIIFS